MFLAAIGLSFYHHNGGFGNVNPAILALAYIFRLARLELLGLRVSAKQSFQYPKQGSDDDQQYYQTHYEHMVGVRFYGQKVNFKVYD
jgi:hypothetical protein